MIVLISLKSDIFMTITKCATLLHPHLTHLFFTLAEFVTFVMFVESIIKDALSDFSELSFMLC